MKILRIFSRQAKREHTMIIQSLAETSKKMDEFIEWLNHQDEDCNPNEEEEK